MERFTERDEFGNADIIGVASTELQGNLDFEESDKVTNALNCLAAYEETGLAPDEIPTGLELANVYAAISKLKEYQATGMEPEEITAAADCRHKCEIDCLLRECNKLQEELKIAKTAVCEFCRKRAEEQRIICACPACKFGGRP